MAGLIGVPRIMAMATKAPAIRVVARQMSKNAPVLQSTKIWPRLLAGTGVTVASGLAVVAYCESTESKQEGIQLPGFLTGLFGSSDKPVPAVKPDETPVETVNATDNEVEGPDTADLPVISLAEVRKHKSEDSIWVTYEGVVYDVTSFVEHHPGGKALLLTAGGLDLEHFFKNYTVHLQNGKEKARGYLNGLAIGKLSEEEAEEARISTTPAAHIESRMSVLWSSRWKMVRVMVMMPVWLALRTSVRIVGLLSTGLANYLADLLPVSVPGYGGAKPLPPIRDDGRKTRVAVIGGGIAGSGCAYTLARSGYDVTIYEARETLCGNAKQWEWDVNGRTLTSCVSVTAWPAPLYKNYVELLKQINVKTTPMPLSWFLHSKVPGLEGFLWTADPNKPEGSLRKRFATDFERYDMVQKAVRRVTNFFTLEWFGDEVSMYTPQTGFGVLNPLNTIPLHTICRAVGISQEWWDIVFTPQYTASFLSDKLDNMCAVIAPIIEVNIPLNPIPENSKDRVITTCETWADAGKGIREVFEKLTKDATVYTGTRVLDVKMNDDDTKTVYDETGRSTVVDKVVFACQCTAIGNMHKQHNWIEESMLAVPEYADDWHPGTGHMHAIMHNDPTIVPEEYREDVIENGSNYVEVSQNSDGDLNIENTYNFGVQSPGVKWYKEIPADQRPPLLISHALTEGKEVNPSKIVGTGAHFRAHPLYSPWNIMTMLSLRLAQGRQGVYYCANWTTPGNCHDMSLLSGIVAAHAIGAEYPFPEAVEAKRDFFRLRGLMGL